MLFFCKVEQVAGLYYLCLIAKVHLADLCLCKLSHRTLVHVDWVEMAGVYNVCYLLFSSFSIYLNDDDFLLSSDILIPVLQTTVIV